MGIELAGISVSTLKRKNESYNLLHNPELFMITQQSVLRIT